MVAAENLRLALIFEKNVTTVIMVRPPLAACSLLPSF